ncbi:MAG TPA: tetratricopeptide repeat protein, partial [Actinoplanes sp.]|nr:tetratricopeptide repeat protein [Actinoplanes sp.]
ARTAPAAVPAPAPAAGVPAPAAPAAPAAGVPAARVPGNLPHPLTRLIGREPQVAELRTMLLNSGVRLVTLVGAPGIGKSRLGTQVAQAMREVFPDGVWYVALGLINDADLVVPTIVKTLGLKETVGVEPLETLLGYLRDRRVLLLLDNLEHVLNAAPAIAATLTGCSGAKVLATSRSPLRIRGERRYPVPPLRAPAVKGQVSAAVAAAYPAVQLFVERAQEAQPDFELTDSTATDICRICADLDGLPLAIELVAARSQALSPAELVARLGDRLGLLTDGPRDSPAHQRTLRSTIGWSYEVLDPAEQRLFARLAVFTGGFPLGAAEEVAGTADLDLPVLDGLIGLADKNLLQLEERADGQRYGVMLATIREYGLERLAADQSEHDLLRRRHADYYLRQAELCRPHLGGPQQRLWLDRLDADQHNLRAALAWHTQHGDIRHAALMIVGIWYFWHIRFRQTEGLHWIEQVLARPDEHDPRVRAQVLYGAGWLAVDHCDHELARRYFAESLAQYRALDDVRGVAEVLHGVGTVAQTGGDSAQAVEIFEESLRCYRQVGDEEGTGWSLDHLGNASLDLGDYCRADELFAEALGIFRRLRHSWGAALALHHLGLTALATGRHAAARQRFSEARQLFTELANTWGVAISCDHLGHVALAIGEYAAAREHFVESLTSSHAEDDRHGVARSLAGLASVAVADGDLIRAARLFGGAEALADSSGIWMNPITRARHDRDTAVVRQELSRAPIARAWAAGRAMTPAEMVAAAV